MVSRIKPQDQRRRAVRLDLSLQHIAAVALVKGIARKRLVLFIRLDRVAGRAITDLGRIRNLLAGLGVVAEQRVRRLIARYRVFLSERFHSSRFRKARMENRWILSVEVEGVTARRDRIAPFYRDFRILFVLSAGRALPRIIGNIRQIVQIDLSFVTVRAAADHAVHMPASLILDDIPCDVITLAVCRQPRIFLQQILVVLVDLRIDLRPCSRRDLRTASVTADLFDIGLRVHLGDVVRQVRNGFVVTAVRRHCRVIR